MGPLQLSPPALPLPPQSCLQRLPSMATLVGGLVGESPNPAGMLPCLTPEGSGAMEGVGAPFSCTPQ